jgi:hypothetical protein
MNKRSQGRSPTDHSYDRNKDSIEKDKKGEVTLPRCRNWKVERFAYEEGADLGGKIFSLARYDLHKLVKACAAAQSPSPLPGWGICYSQLSASPHLPLLHELFCQNGQPLRIKYYPKLMPNKACICRFVFCLECWYVVASICCSDKVFRCVAPTSKN